MILCAVVRYKCRAKAFLKCLIIKHIHILFWVIVVQLQKVKPRCKEPG